MPPAYGDRMTTFEDSEKESEFGYVRKVSFLELFPESLYRFLMLEFDKI